MNKYQALLDRCTGPAPKAYVKPKPITGIERNQLERLDSIDVEFHRFFDEKEK
jgi:hypothetical protein